MTANTESETVPHHPVIIAGSGIAGLTAAIYAARANNNPLVLEGDEPGGQLTLTADVENYPGFPDGVGGSELVMNMKEQAERFNATIEHGTITDIDDTERPFTVHTTTGKYTCDAFISASGASARTLDIPGENELMGYGVSTCATCDGAFFRDEDMLVIGGGDAAVEEAAFLTRFADTVYLAHRRDELRAEHHLKNQLQDHVNDGNLEILWNTEIEEITGSQENGVDTAHLITNSDGYPSDKPDDSNTEYKNLDVGAVFIAIGHTPNTEYLQGTNVKLDSTGYINTKRGAGSGQTATDVPGIFAAGDVADHHYQQAITAGGMGCKAALDVDDFLAQQ